MTTLVWINPSSRSGDTDCDAQLDRLRSIGNVEVHERGKGADLADLVESLSGTLSRIVVGGGDGTVNHALPVLQSAKVPVGILPLGTANDFARSLDIPPDLDKAIDVILSGSQRKVGLGEANGHLFLNAAGVGLGPELTKTLDEDKKQRLGVLAYFSSLIKVVGHQRRTRATLDLDGHIRQINFMQITIANGRHYGGGLTISEDAKLDDGLLRVLYLKPQSPLELFSKFATLRWGARKDEYDEKLQLFTAKRVRLETAMPHDVTIDGELETKTPLVCSIYPDYLNVYAPRMAADDETAAAA